MDEDKPVIPSVPSNRGNKTIPQEWYDDNRKTFGAESTGVEIKTEKCPHQGFLFRTQEGYIQCSHCHAGWVFPPTAKLVDGKII